MATAKRKESFYKHPVVLKLTQDEADLIRSVLVQFSFGRRDPERDLVSSIFFALDKVTTCRPFRLDLSGPELRTRWVASSQQAVRE
jgi:hypothetical protein